MIVIDRWLGLLAGDSPLLMMSGKVPWHDELGHVMGHGNASEHTSLKGLAGVGTENAFVTSRGSLGDSLRRTNMRL
jgi:hypothetical protein